ncbi:uncharacterized protein [Rutidosis leptorrhynchoides]|uniref:uncharacterized protein n=1 Tax=Rutidosis leptorrhynchoides TaxID=125765 RepID=UPI003A99571D
MVANGGCGGLVTSPARFALKRLISWSTLKSLKETPKKLKQDLVGCSIKVWWPLDKMYHKGVVSSYDSITGRYKVLYADGDEELLDLHHEKWIILDNLKNDPVQTPPDVSFASKKRVAENFGGKETPKKWKQDLVGCTIKVWWPLDKMYHKGVVSSYDSITDRYKVLYADGDEELLNLHHEKWIILDNLKNDPVQTPPDVSFASKKRVAKDFGGKETPKKWKQDLVGCTIKVWWPLDKMYYTCVVSSYDSITDRYKVLYADGDEELLNLHHEKWIILDNLKNDPVQTPPDVSFASKKRVAKDFGGKETPKKLKQNLVGCTIKVWWPLDKMYYKGVVSSYDSITESYKVLYVDGDEELLKLHHEKWMIEEMGEKRPTESGHMTQKL